jgi:hypothetical protein
VSFDPSPTIVSRFVDVSILVRSVPTAGSVRSVVDSVFVGAMRLSNTSPTR